MPLSAEQARVIVETIRNYGTLAFAAQNAGVAASVVKREMERDPDFAEEIEDAMAPFKDGLRMLVLQRAATSDAMLKLAVEGFIPETFKAAPLDTKAKGKPTGLTLRQFDDEGKESAPTPPLLLLSQ